MLEKKATVREHDGGYKTMQQVAKREDEEVKTGLICGMAFVQIKNVCGQIQCVIWTALLMSTLTSTDLENKMRQNGRCANGIDIVWHRSVERNFAAGG